jgi:hypothetical protein
MIDKSYHVTSGISQMRHKKCKNWVYVKCVDKHTIRKYVVDYVTSLEKWKFTKRVWQV